MRRHFPQQADGTIYLTEGGQETEIQYRHGHHLPEFAMFPLLDQPKAVEDMTAMYQRYLDVAVAAGMPVMMGGLDYRASPDWGAKLGYSPAALASMQVRCIDFLREVAEPYRSRLPAIYISGVAGPRGDAYSLNQSITAESAEAYHFAQLSTLAQAGVDLVTAMTFNSVPEAVGVARAAARLDLPLCVSFTLDSGTARLKSGPTLREAIEATDAEAGDAKPDFFGVNCSHPYEFIPALEAGDWIRRIRMLRPNASAMDKIELCQIGHLEEGDPGELGRLMGDLAARYPHIDIFGGCCGTWDKHLEQIARQVKHSRK
ncbi:MAG: homocysteine S-methyltransferase family protein [Gammaproteobacteria bacterium]|nr:homocysteine S-methyltransferase family protein [Gammaproteobacteria bacterium]